MGTSMAIAEGLSIQWGIQMAVDLNMDCIVRQSYVLSVVDCLNRFAFDVFLEPIIVYCWSLFKRFVDVSIMFVNMSQNQVAHHFMGISYITSLWSKRVF